MKWVIRGVLALAVLLVAAFLVLRVPDTDPEAMQARWGGEPSQFVEIGDRVTVHLRDEFDDERPLGGTPAADIITTVATTPASALMIVHITLVVVAITFC